MNAVVFALRPDDVKPEALKALSDAARRSHKSVEDLVAEYVNSFAPVEEHAAIVGRDEYGPILSIPDPFVYHPKRDADGALILPASWDDGDDLD